ncbi:MAG TPA: hypothetical protein VMF58_06940, partial [Rhizomicrobium sp.]|nr:hypothetical protein [Rhizomicrobium sp.]
MSRSLQKKIQLKRTMVLCPMWIYRKEHLAMRLETPRAIGFWLDYWLFLHLETNHGFWRARPLGLRSLCETALRTNEGDSAAIRELLKKELHSSLRWIRSIPSIPQPPDEIKVEPSKWRNEWMAWFEKTMKQDIVPSVVEHLSFRIAEELSDSNYSAAAFLTRRLAEQISDDGHGERFRASMALKSVQHHLGTSSNLNSVPAVAALIRQATLPDREEREFVVSCSLTPAVISRTKFDRSKLWPKFIFQEHQGPELILVGLRVPVRTLSAEQAASRALGEFERILEGLRIRYYVQTNLYGRLCVTPEDGSKPIDMDLPQPFWTRKSGSRTVPYLPQDYRQVIGLSGL